MDEYYDRVKAAERLEDIARDRTENVHAGLQLATLCKEDTWENKYSVVRIGNPPTWRLIHNTSEPNDVPGNDPASSADMEEVVFGVQGIVLRRNELPPLMDRLGQNSRAVRYIRQGLTIAGFGTESFHNATDSIAKIYALFSRSLVLKTPLQCTTMTSSAEEGSIAAFNRYFTPRKEGNHEQEIPFGNDIDPTGMLSKLANGNYFHGEDNVVQYYERIIQSGQHKYVPVAPVKIQIGDIVELQVSMVTVSLRDGGYKLSTLLRSVTLLDGTETQRAVVSRLGSQIAPVPSGRMKRKVGYEDEEIADARAKMSRMELI